MKGARAHIGLALATGCTVALVTYALLRAWQVLVVGEANPVTIFARMHMAFFWRAWTSAYVGGMAAFAGYYAARRDPLRLARAVAPALVVATSILAAQALFLP